MAGKMKEEGTVTKYEVFALYKLHGNYYPLRAYRPTIEGCYEWIREHPTKEVPLSFNTSAVARMNNYTIFKDVSTRSVVEKKKIER